MLGILLESSAHADRRFGSTAVSFMSHLALIGSAVAVTASGAKHQFDLRKPEVVRLVVPKPAPVQPVSRPPEARPEQAAAASVSIQIPSITRIAIPTIIPDVIPEPGNLQISSDDAIVIGGSTSSAPGRGVAGSVVGGGGDDGWGRDVVEVNVRLEKTPKPPHYPDMLRSAGITGQVTVRFVVDTLGRVEPESVQIVQSTHALFTEAVRTTLRELRFIPATTGGHKVRAAAIMPFEFTLNR